MEYFYRQSSHKLHKSDWRHRYCASRSYRYVLLPSDNASGFIWCGNRLGRRDINRDVYFCGSPKAEITSYLLNSLNLLLLLLVGISGLISIDTVRAYGLGQAALGAVVQYSVTALWWGVTFRSVVTTLVHTLILASLVLQDHAVFAAQPRIQKNVTIILSIAATVGFALALTWNALYQRCVWTEMGCPSYNGRPPYDNMYIGAECILEAILAVACVVLVGKLVFSIRFRRQAGIRKFGVFHILMITFGQCLIIPRISIFCVSKA